MAKEFKHGNIVSSPYQDNGVYIVIRVRFDAKAQMNYYTLIPFDSNNCQMGRFEKSTFNDEECYKCDAHIGYPNVECENCKGKGTYKKEDLGMDGYQLLASNMKQYIIDRLLKNFEF